MIFLKDKTRRDRQDTTRFESNRIKSIITNSRPCYAAQWSHPVLPTACVASNRAPHRTVRNGMARYVQIIYSSITATRRCRSQCPLPPSNRLFKLVEQQFRMSTAQYILLLLYKAKGKTRRKIPDRSCILHIIIIMRIVSYYFTYTRTVHPHHKVLN